MKTNVKSEVVSSPTETISVEVEKHPCKSDILVKNVILEMSVQPFEPTSSHSKLLKRSEVSRSMLLKHQPKGVSVSSQKTQKFPSSIQLSVETRET